MKGRENKVPGLRSFKCDLRSFKITHLADENHFWRLAQGRTECRRKVARVVTDFALVNRRTFVQVQILDWIFDRDDMVVLLLVDDVDDCGLSRALAGTGWTSHEHEAVAKLGDIGQMRRQPESLQSGNVRRNDAHYDGVNAALLEDIHAEARS